MDDRSWGRSENGSSIGIDPRPDHLARRRQSRMGERRDHVMGEDVIGAAGKMRIAGIEPGRVDCP